LSDLDLIGDDETSSHQVNKVSREQVFGEEQLARTTLEAPKVDLATFEGHASSLQAADLSYRNEEIPSLDLYDGAHNRRMGVITKSRDQVLDASYSVAVRVEDRTTQKRGEVENFGHGTP
jgi:hypothetical protein